MSQSDGWKLAFAKACEGDWVSCVDPEVFDEDLKPEFLLPYLQDPNHWLLLAWQDGRVIGKCSAVVHLRPDKPCELYIDEIDVTPDFRRRGVAKAMMDRMLDRAEELGIPECWVGTEDDNVPARALYESLAAEPESFVLYYLKG